MTAALVIRDDHDGVATLTLNRPDKLNALHAGVFSELGVHLDRLAEDRSIRCLVLTGAGRSFCAGHDLSMLAPESEDARHLEARTIDALEAFPRPTIAKIRGHCLTGGLELALGCDLLIGAETASFADTHGTWGLVPVWGMSVRLPERVGRARAKLLSFTSRRVDGRTALEYGLLDQCVPEGELDAAVAGLATEIAANSPGTNEIYKKLYGRCGELTRRSALDSERELPFGLPDDMRERLGG